MPKKKYSRKWSRPVEHKHRYAPAVPPQYVEGADGFRYERWPCELCTLKYILVRG